MAEVIAGQPAPSFSLPLDDGTTFDLAGQRGRPVVVYFYPQDDTEGCTAEAIAFSRLLPEFRQAGAAVIGMSPDSAKKHGKFKAKYGLAHPLGADERLDVTKAYGVWGEKTTLRPDLYGRGAGNVPDRRRRTHCSGLATRARQRPRRGRPGCRAGAGRAEQISPNPADRCCGIVLSAGKALLTLTLCNCSRGLLAARAQSGRDTVSAVDDIRQGTGAAYGDHRPRRGDPLLHGAARAGGAVQRRLAPARGALSAGHRLPGAA